MQRQTVLIHLNCNWIAGLSTKLTLFSSKQCDQAKCILRNRFQVDFEARHMPQSISTSHESWEHVQQLEAKFATNHKNRNVRSSWFAKFEAQIRRQTKSRTNIHFWYFYLFISLFVSVAEWAIGRLLFCHCYYILHCCDCSMLLFIHFSLFWVGSRRTGSSIPSLLVCVLHTAQRIRHNTKRAKTMVEIIHANV